MAKLKVRDLIILASAAQHEVVAGNLSLDSDLHISLEVCKDDDESTFQNRVHGGEAIEVCVSRQFGGGTYVRIQLKGEPNFEVYDK